MGLLASCCLKTAESEVVVPSAEIRRQLQHEAAERRQMENERRGIKDPERFKQMQAKRDFVDRRQEEAAKSGEQPTLRWQAN